MISTELRTKYLTFFESKGHLIHPSDSLAPDDPTLLFTSAGMVQFKPYFVGHREPPSKRIATCQKCLRTDDIDEVGDAVHHTFFEMLGNFSFGDYFKREAILWAWEFLTEVLKLDPENLWTSVYLDDDEAADVWIKEIGFPADKVVRLGEDKNYWPANAPSKGPNGPCGPCNEIFLDVTPELGRPAAPTYSIAHDGNRFVEIWNLVFQQFNRLDDGTMKPLPTKNIDTGMGLERTVAVLQKTPTDYETDIFLPIIKHIEEISGASYGSSEETDRSIRVIADHIRGAVFAIEDGVMPLNVGRGYVLRRLIRNAVVKGRNLGLVGSFLSDIVPTVVEIMRPVYPEIGQVAAGVKGPHFNSERTYAEIVIGAEEDRFRRTLDAGLQRLEEQIKLAVDSTDRRLDGEAVFTLYDTYGFPLELTRDIAAQKGIGVDMEGFEAAMAEQRERAKVASEFGAVMTVGEGSTLFDLEKTVEPTRFLGYEQTAADATVVAIVKGQDRVNKAWEGDKIEVVLDQTPFYAESGGQVGDTGYLKSDDLWLNVADTIKASHFTFHKATVASGSRPVSVGDKVHAVVYVGPRRAIARAHTATHLLHAALHKVLGRHALQRGSLVEPDKLRFDFSHPQAVTDDEFRQIEIEVNEMILADLESTTSITSQAEARKMGATALFGEKYGDKVRLVKIGNVSAELCGGTHLERSSQVGFFKLISESSIGAGLRRIEAVTGERAVEHVHNLEDQMRVAASALGAAPAELVVSAERTAAAAREAQRQLEQVQAKGAAQQAEGFAEAVQNIAGVNVVTGKLSGANIDALSLMADSVVDRLKSVVVVLGGISDGKVMFVSKVTSDLVAKGFHAGNLVREVAKVAGGGGGGRPEFAQAGAKDPNMVDDALAKAVDLVRLQAEA